MYGFLLAALLLGGAAFLGGFFMGMNDTPSADRVHIGFFGRRNAGKSSVVNAVTNQQLSVVSDTLGTTTDPVAKAMEILPLGPVVIIDTPGFDDEGTLGEQRVKRTKQVLNRVDCAVLVMDCTAEKGACEKQLEDLFQQKKIPYIIVKNKCDLLNSKKVSCGPNEMFVSAIENKGINELRERIAGLIKTDESRTLVGDIVKSGDNIILVVPIDSAAPKGRLILPQQQVIRGILDADAAAITVKENRVKETIDIMSKKPDLVITDSQAFGVVAKAVPKEIPLTSFSILMARYKGFLETAVKGAGQIDKLSDGDKVLISEGCTHHRQCDDIGSVKIPRWLKEYTGKNIVTENTSGRDFPENLSEYKLIIHCGGCMLNGREMRYRMKCAEDSEIPFTNYGAAIAYMKGILKRSLEIFPDLANLI